MSRAAFLFTLLATLVAAGVFYSDPDLDLRIARLFFDHGFMGASPVARAARGFFYGLPLTLCIGFVLARWPGADFLPPALVPSSRAVAFVVLSMAIGPGLVVNLGLKDNMHRPRPAQVKEFGGPWDFRPVFARDGECRRNCSFVSGEASSAFWLMAPASLAPGPLKIPAMAAAVGVGVVTSVLRMAFGGHFLSDVVFAALITLLLLQILHALIFAGLRGAPARL